MVKNQRSGLAESREINEQGLVILANGIRNCENDNNEPAFDQENKGFQKANKRTEHISKRNG